MIEVLNETSNVFYTQKCKCCGAELRYTEEDTQVEEFGVRFLKCPVCSEKILSNISDLVLTHENIEFPKHFYKTREDAIDVPDARIQDWIREILTNFKQGTAKEFSYIGTGNTFIVVLEVADAYDIYVAKNYWECSVPKR